MITEEKLWQECPKHLNWPTQKLFRMVSYWLDLLHKYERNEPTFWEECPLPLKLEVTKLVKPTQKPFMMVSFWLNPLHKYEINGPTIWQEFLNHLNLKKNQPKIFSGWFRTGWMQLELELTNPKTFQDGFVLVGSVAGQRYWSTMLPAGV